MADRTLIVSDLHLGTYDGCSVLERPEVLEFLLAALDGCARLVLLGDVIELKEADPRHAWRATQPVLRALGKRLGHDRDVVFVPGNHDHLLVRKWVRAQGRKLQTEAVVPADASPLLTQFVAALAPARVEVRYPGVWLNDQVWAHHGHYLTQHLMPRATWGLIRERAHVGALGNLLPTDYETARSGRVGSLVRFLPRPALSGVEDIEDRARARTAPRTAQRVVTRPHDWLLHPRFFPTVSGLLGAQMRLHSVPAVARVAHNLGVEPDQIVFGHVHRRGPMPTDDPSEWQIGTTRVVNTGSWRWERVLVQGANRPHPYWPGGAIVIDGAGTPESVGLLDGVSEAEFMSWGVHVR